MKFKILNHLSVLFIIEICHRSFAKLSIPTRDFSLRVPQAKPSQPETYVSLMCNYQKFSEKYVKTNHIFRYTAEIEGFYCSLQVCTPLRLDKSNTYYIVGFEPLAEKYTAHHMLLYGKWSYLKQSTLLKTYFTISSKCLVDNT